METKKNIQSINGVVVSTKMQKTVVVEVTRLRKHPKYQKYMRITKRYKAHNELPDIQEGDKVTIRSSRPISREKHWVVVGKAL